jgi:hypothetical protein
VAKIDGGYILLARKILHSEIMKKPPLYMKLWIWMLEKANHKDFKNGIKRGQFITTIDDMREAMSWMVGYRKMTPTRGQIRGCYEGFNESNMVNTTKSTRGMIITILNYNEYQSPKNYEVHSEKSTKRSATTHDIQESKEYKKYIYKKNVPIPRDFQLTDEMKAYAKKKNFNVDLDDFTERFIIKAKAKGYVYKNWYAAWQNWLQNEMKWNPQSTQPKNFMTEEKFQEVHR